MGEYEENEEKSYEGGFGVGAAPGTVCFDTPEDQLASDSEVVSVYSGFTLPNSPRRPSEPTFRREMVDMFLDISERMSSRLGPGNFSDAAKSPSAPTRLSVSPLSATAAM